MANHVIQHGKADAQSALGHIDVVRTLLAEAADMDDVLENVDAAEVALGKLMAAEREEGTVTRPQPPVR